MQDDRRDILKKIGIGTAWTTPVIQSIILPAHAQCSATTDSPTLSISVISFNTGCSDEAIDRVYFGEATLRNDSCTDIEITSGSMIFGEESVDIEFINFNEGLPATVSNGEQFEVNNAILIDQETCDAGNLAVSLMLNTSLGTFTTSA